MVQPRVSNYVPLTLISLLQKLLNCCRLAWISVSECWSTDVDV